MGSLNKPLAEKGMNMNNRTTDFAIVGGGLGGLVLALHLHRQGVSCDVFEAAPALNPKAVGITLVPHAMAQLSMLGVADAVEAAGIVNQESVCYNRYGQFIYRELRGRHAGYPMPEVGIHRSTLHQILWNAVVERLGQDHVHAGHRFVRMHHGEGDVTLSFTDPEGRDLPSVRARLMVAADGVNSAVRRVFYPDDAVVFTGVNTWRGVTRHAPFLTGKSYVRLGSVDTGKMVIYPIADNVDGQGAQLISWVAEVGHQPETRNDWLREGRSQDLMPWFKNWTFDWLNVPELIRHAETIWQYPAVDKDPIPQWTFGRVSLLGDAAHPIYPRGANALVQAMLDAHTLAEEMARCAAGEDPVHALQRYEAVRKPQAYKAVLTQRTTSSDCINIKVNELTQGQPFRNINEVISQAELRQISDDYKRITGFALDTFSTTN